MAGVTEPPPSGPSAAHRAGEVEQMIEPVVPARLGWLADLLGAAPGERIVDLGCGTGSTLEMIAGRLPEADLELLGLDVSAAALRAAERTLGRLPSGPRLLVQADLASRVPLASASVDRALCHNVLECLRDPDALVAEACRIVRPGGRFVLSHSDFDTLVFASEDLELTRRLVRVYCDTQQDWMDTVDGTIGRRLVDIVGRSQLEVEDVQARVNLSRRFQPGELGYGYAHNLTAALRASDQVDQAELDGWLAGLRRLDARGAFLFSVNDYAVICARP
ncbi:MAG TPA: methyltransferase domain-containing protein [Actinomycetes bacterium]|jgi:SAM-dependent methyltransferase|nr:methyltransferase domain-containing protein [Actinomycetes bacterium]